MHWIGFDVGKAFHWLCVLDDEGEEMLSRRVGATEEDLEAACSEIEALGEDRAVGIDLMGWPATLLEAILLGRGERGSSTCRASLSTGPATPTRASPRAMQGTPV